MLNLLIDLGIFIAGLVILSVSAHLLVNTLEYVTTKLKVSKFKFSMVLLGLLTSLPELSIGINAAIDNTPEIYIGNLLGGIIIVFLWIIPFLAVFGKGIKVDHNMKITDLAWTLSILFLPPILIIDHNLSVYDSLLLIFAYILRIILMKNKHSVNIVKKNNYKILGVGLGITIFLCTIIFLTSSVVVDKSISIANEFNIPSFLVGLFILTIGTNLPEFTIAINAVRSGRKEIAFGDHLGSAMSNTLIMGICGLISVNAQINFDAFRLTSFFVLISLLLFYIFIKSKSELSQKEGFLLLSMFLIFSILQILIK